MHIRTICLSAAVLLSGLFYLTGCSRQPNPTQATTPAAPEPAASSVMSETTPVAALNTLAPATPLASDGNLTEHGHIPGAHGGIMVSLGRDSYHVEAVFEKGGVLRLYTLGKDETRVIDVEQQALRGFVKAVGENEAQQFTLESERQEGDAEGRTSQFAGKLPEGFAGKDLEITVPSIVISGERFRLGFQSAAEQHDEGMPDKVSDDAERELYLTPGGIYTDADIAANGNLTASVKFKGKKSSHDMRPQPGDKICPVTMTKANPIFTWVISGKTYEFCCPPCVDEFVRMAKESPDEIEAPEEYVKQ
jgi:YHS domain-containing protein